MLGVVIRTAVCGSGSRDVRFAGNEALVVDADGTGLALDEGVETLVKIVRAPSVV